MRPTANETFLIDFVSLEKCEFEHYDVFAMDVLVSTGEGQGRELDTKVSIYKKTEESYLLKLKTSRTFYAEVIVNSFHLRKANSMFSSLKEFVSRHFAIRKC